jgi:UDP-3-O-[3-hydroxymyristoyl] glucosamine N-acyltransferase
VVISRDPVSCAEILKRFPHLFVDSVGDLAKQIVSVRSPDNATPDSAVFLATPKSIATGLNSQAGVMVVSRKNREQAEKQLSDRTLLIASNVELAMASVISDFFLATPYTNRRTAGIHPTAVIAPDASLGTGVRVGPHAFIGSGVRIGNDVYVGSSSVIEDDTVIGDQTVIHPQVFIGHSTEIGKKCEIHPQSVVGKEGFGYAHDEKGNHFRIPHQGRVIIEDDVHIGACCTIDRATFGETRIETGAKFDNQVHIAHNCRIGRNSLITAGFAVAGSTRIGANFVTGGGSMVTGHIEVCDNVQIAGFSAVRKSIDKAGQYGGNPLLPLKDHLKALTASAQGHEMRKQIQRILTHLGLEKDSEGQSEHGASNGV